MGTVLRFDDPSLLRVARVADVLHNCGQVLASSSGTADTYNLSSQADCIEVFISHNWALGRKRKFLALAMHFNLDMAVCFATVVLVIGTCFTYLVARLRWSAVDIEHVPTICAATLLAFCIALLFGHEVRGLFFVKGESVFLDKVCIHQVDSDLKQRGILSLGAFLRRSEAIVVCFTEIYLKKLWTVYEFATFLLVHGEAPGLVHIMPAILPAFALATSFCIFFTNIAQRVCLAAGEDGIATVFIGNFAACAIVVGLARWWARQQLAAGETFRDFELEKTSCASESDRPLVEGSIVALMRHCGHVDLHAPDRDALLAFDAFVRTAGSRAFVMSVGRLGVPYKLMLPVLLPVFANSMDTWSASVGYQLANHRDSPQIALMLTAHVTGVFLVLPLVAALALHLAKCFLHLRGVAQFLYCGLVAVLVFLALAVFDPADGILRPWLLDPALEAVHSCWSFLVYCGAMFVMTACVYRQPQWKAATGALTRRPGTAGVEAPAASMQSAGVGLEVVSLDVCTALQSASEVTACVSASPSSPGQPDLAEPRTCWVAKVAPTTPDSCTLEFSGQVAEPWSVPPALQPGLSFTEVSSRVVEL